jgi:hypothetical protein
MPSQTQSRAPLWRLILARVLVVLGILFLAVTILASYLRWQAFDDETFNETSSELIANDTVRDQVAATLVDQLYANVDVAAELEQRLPADQQRLAGPISAALREVADRLAERLLERPRVQELWIRSLSNAHDQLVRVLRDESVVVTVQGAAVVIDVRQLVIELGEQLGIGGDLASRIPEGRGAIKVLPADKLERAQDLTSFFETVATWIWIVPLLLWAIAIWLARGRRRVEVRAIAIGIVVAGLAVLVLRSVMGSYVVDSLVASSSVEPAAQAAWDIVTDLLADGAWSAIAIGLVALLGVWLAGPSTTGAATRRWLAPVLARWDLTYGILAVLYLLFIWWRPFAQAQRPLWVIVVGVLLVLGVEALRRLSAREHPDAASVSPRELMRPLGRLRPRSSGAPTSTASQADELERLARLHADGILTDEELASAKARALAPH